MGRECNVYGVEERRYRALVGKCEGKRPLGRRRLDGKILLRWIYRKWVVVVWTGLKWLRTGTFGEHV